MRGRAHSNSTVNSRDSKEKGGSTNFIIAQQCSRHNVKSGKTKSTQFKGAVQGKKKETNQQKDEPKCIHCGGTKHVFAKCKYKTYKCRICSKEGHLAKICKSKKGTVASTNYLESRKIKDTEVVDIYNFSNTLASEEHC